MNAIPGAFFCVCVAFLLVAGLWAAVYEVWLHGCRKGYQEGWRDAEAAAALLRAERYLPDNVLRLKRRRPAFHDDTPRGAA